MTSWLQAGWDYRHRGICLVAKYTKQGDLFLRGNFSTKHFSFETSKFKAKLKSIWGKLGFNGLAVMMTKLMNQSWLNVGLKLQNSRAKKITAHSFEPLLIYVVNIKVNKSIYYGSIANVIFMVLHWFHWNSLSLKRYFTFTECHDGWFLENFGSSPTCKKACWPIVAHHFEVKRLTCQFQGMSTECFFWGKWNGKSPVLCFKNISYNFDLYNLQF